MSGLNRHGVECRETKEMTLSKVILLITLLKRISAYKEKAKEKKTSNNSSENRKFKQVSLLRKRTTLFLL